MEKYRGSHDPNTDSVASLTLFSSNSTFHRWQPLLTEHPDSLQIHHFAWEEVHSSFSKLTRGFQLKSCQVCTQLSMTYLVNVNIPCQCRPGQRWPRQTAAGWAQGPHYGQSIRTWTLHSLQSTVHLHIYNTLQAITHSPSYGITNYTEWHTFQHDFNTHI